MKEFTDRICGIGLPADHKTMEKIKVIDLTIGVFFDGTCNNKYNLDAPSDGVPIPDDSNQSYVGTYSNVAELFESYKENKGNNEFKVYVEGIGTEEPVFDINGKEISSGMPDDQDGYGFGKGDMGINAKIERGCKLIVDKLHELKDKGGNEETTIGTLTLDVFGFSRGAAAARCFVSRIERKFEDNFSPVDMNEIMAQCDDDFWKQQRAMSARRKSVSETNRMNLRQCLTLNHMSVEKIEVRFLGLFDTVSSFAPGTLALDRDFSNDVKELPLHVPDTVKRTVHLVAGDEYRLHFALTRVNPSGKLTELILPGAHLDVGGGYSLFELEKMVVRKAYRDEPALYRSNMSKDEIVDGNWVKQAPSTLEWNQSGKIIRKNDHIRSYRIVNNSYSKIPLHLMGELAKKEELAFDVEKYENMVKLPAKVTVGVREGIYSNEQPHSFSPAQDLAPLKSRIMGMGATRQNELYVFHEETERMLFGLLDKSHTKITETVQLMGYRPLRSDYIHLSAQTEKALWGMFIEPHEPADQRMRIIYQS